MTSRLTRTDTMLADQHAWIAKATDVRLALVHRDHNRWLNLPGSELWAEEHAERTAEMTAIWQEIQRRKAKPEKAAMGQSFNTRKRAA